MALASLRPPALPRAAARARARDGRRRLRRWPRSTGAGLAPPRAAASSWRTSTRDLAACGAAAPGGGAARAGRLAARAHRRARAGDGRRGGAQLRGQLAPGRATGPSTRSGCSRRPATPAPRSVPRCTSPHGWATPAADGQRRPRPGFSDDELAGLAGHGRASPTSGRPTSPRPSPRCWPTTASSPGSRGAASTGPRALGHRSLLADPRRPGQPRAAQRRQGTRAVSGRSRRWCCAERAAEIFDGAAPEPLHALHPSRAPGWARAHPRRRARRRHGAHPDRRRGARSRWSLAMLRGVRAAHGRAGASSTRASTRPGRPMVDDPRDALECFGSAPVDVLAIGPYSCVQDGSERGADARDGGGERVSDFDIVIPTIGRPPLKRLLAALAAMRDRDGYRAGAGSRVIVVDDRPRGVAADPLAPRALQPGRCWRRAWRSSAGRRAVRPRRATSVGARRGRVGRVSRRRRDSHRSWLVELSLDLERASQRCAAVQGRSACPARRAPDRLGTQRWRTGNGPLGHRRHGLPASRARAVGGFDERFPRAYREDADLAFA